MHIKAMNDLMQLDICIKSINNLQQTEPEQAMQTHPDIGLMTARL